MVIALSNLYRNAAQYSLGADSRFRVFTQVRTSSNSLNRTSVDIEVTNVGMGIPDDVRELIFQEFFRYTGTEPDLAIRGMGLGLFLVRQIARCHNGDATLVGSRSAGKYFRREGHEKVEVYNNTFRFRFSTDLPRGDYEFALPESAATRPTN